MSKALVVLSGGLDSCVALALADREHEAVETVSFDYGQRHSVELEAAARISAAYNAKWNLLEIPLGRGGVLMEHDAEMPHMTYEDLQEVEGPSATYVPYRNGTMLSHATSLALEIQADTLYAGMHAEDAHNWAYPDCTPEFIGAMQNAIYIGTYMKVRFIAPFTYKSKAEIVKLGVDLAAPLHYTRSCYEGKEAACGECPTCVGRLEAFKLNGLQDPIAYKNDANRIAGYMRAEVVRESLELNRRLEREA